MRWIVDTSAWSRRNQPEFARQLSDIVRGGDELALSAPVLFELLRAPQGAQVAEERERLTTDLPVLPLSAMTVTIAADAMEELANDGPEAHRLPVPDLLTAAAAHEQGAGVVHCGTDFEALATRAGLDFPEKRLELEKSDGSPHPAARQRVLRQKLNQALHQLPIEESEKLLEGWVAEAQER